MVSQPPTTAYTEVQIDDDSISLTLITESADGVTIEDTERFTFDELQSLSGEHFTLSLSGDSREQMGEAFQNALVAEMVGEEPDLPETDDVLTDENAPRWSNDDRVRVVGVLEDVNADEYIIDGPREGHLNKSAHRLSDSTVADANPSYPEDDTVIIGRYVGGSDDYAFPASRLQ